MSAEAPSTEPTPPSRYQQMLLDLEGYLKGMAMDASLDDREAAVRLRQNGVPLMIVSEVDFWDAASG